MEYFIGFIVGGIVTAIFNGLTQHRSKQLRIIEQEKEYAILQQHVDKAVDSIEQIMYGNKL